MTRICSKCKKNYQPSSGHKACPQCRYWIKKKKNLCGCGKPMWPGAQTCSACVSDQAGPKNFNWKGGSTSHHAGYIYKMAKWHPRSKKSNGYVFEHILVMENKLGRYLVKGETVHHKNGVRGDNRISNLELWASSQPSGQRVSDLVKWAKQLLKKYDPESLK